MHSMSELDRRGIEAVVSEALERAAGAPFVHISLDMDGLDPDVAPGVGTAVRGGLTYREAHLAMELVAESGLLCCLEIVEVNPILDRAERDGRAGGRARRERVRRDDALGPRGNPRESRIDLTTVQSPITISGCPGNASISATVEVHIVHTWIGDLVVTLIAPDGSSYVLHTRAGGSADNIDQTYTVNLSSEQRNGTWRLRVQDAAARRHRPHRRLDHQHLVTTAAQAPHSRWQAAIDSAWGLATPTDSWKLAGWSAPTARLSVRFGDRRKHGRTCARHMWVDQACAVQTVVVEPA